MKKSSYKSEFSINAGVIRKIAIPALVAVICLAVLIGILCKRLTEPDYSLKDNLNETVMTIDGNVVTLKDTGVYIASIEATVDAMARTYNADDPLEFWKVHFSAGENSTFTNEYAIKYVQNLYIYDYVMEQEAVKKGLSLTDSQTAAAKQEGQEAYSNLTDKARDNLELTEEDVIAVYTRKKVVSVYVNAVAKEMTDSGYEGDDLSTQLGVDGEFYNNSIKSAYTVKLVDKQWSQLPIGSITIN